MPMRRRKLGRSGGQGGDEVVLPCPDAAFSTIGTVSAGWEILEGGNVFVVEKELFERD